MGNGRGAIISYSGVPSIPRDFPFKLPRYRRWKFFGGWATYFRPVCRAPHLRPSWAHPLGPRPCAWSLQFPECYGKIPDGPFRCRRCCSTCIAKCRRDESFLQCAFDFTWASVNAGFFGAQVGFRTCLPPSTPANSKPGLSRHAPTATCRGQAIILDRNINPYWTSTGR